MEETFKVKAFVGPRGLIEPHEFGPCLDFAQKVRVDRKLSSFGGLTPKVFANSSPGFPTLGKGALNIFFTLKELKNRMELLQSNEWR